jgi:hypothetical protein
VRRIRFTLSVNSSDFEEVSANGPARGAISELSYRFPADGRRANFSPMLLKIKKQKVLQNSRLAHHAGQVAPGSARFEFYSGKWGVMRDRGLFLFFLDFHWFKVFGFEDLAAVQTLDVIDAVSPGDYLGTVMVASGLHTLR